MTGAQVSKDLSHEMSVRLQALTTELAAADEELASRQREIHELQHREVHARARLQDALRAAPAPSITTDATGSVTALDRAGSALLGTGPSEVLQEPIWTFVASEHLEDVRGLMSTALAGRVAAGHLRVLSRSAGPVEVDVVVSSADTELGQAVLHWAILTGSGRAADAQRTHGALDALRAMQALTAVTVATAPTQDVLVEIATLTARAVSGADWASLSLGHPDDPTAAGSDSAQAQSADGAQWRAGQGPTASAFHANALVVSDDITADPRWPRLGERARGGAVRGALALPLRTHDGLLGVITFYSRAVSGLSAGADVHRARVFADAAAHVLWSRHHTAELRATMENLRVAMTSRASIEQAKGVMAARFGCGVEEAFVALRLVSQNRNVRLRDIADLLVAAPSDPELGLVLTDALARTRGNSARR